MLLNLNSIPPEDMEDDVSKVLEKEKKALTILWSVVQDEHDN